MTAEEIGKVLEQFKQVFTEATLHSIQLEQENGKMAFFNFSKEAVGESTGDFTLIPAGKYTGQICNHEWKETKKGGHLLSLTLEITGPEQEGRKVFDNLNLDCESEEAQKIALRSYKAICIACNAESFYDGIFEIDETTVTSYFETLPEVLYGNDIALVIGVEKSKDPQYPDKNRIKQYGSSVASSKPTAATAKSTGKPKPTWEKRA